MPNFDPQTAKLCVNLAANCYNGPWQIESAEAHVTITTAADGTQYVCFRGSKSAQDWIEDGEVDLVKWATYGKVHAGFLKSFSSVYLQLQKTLRMDMPVIVTGHSLGGAQAVLGAFNLAGCGFKVLSCYTFGQPRVGNIAFAKACNKAVPNHFRFVNEQDIVPRVPFPHCYWHSGTAYFIEKGVVGNWPKLRPLVWMDLTGVLWAFTKKRQVAFLVDHHTSFYQAAILKL